MPDSPIEFIVLAIRNCMFMIFIMNSAQSRCQLFCYATMMLRFPFTEIYLFKSVFSFVVYIAGFMHAPFMSDHVHHIIKSKDVLRPIIKPSYNVPRNNQCHCSAGYFL